MKANHLAVAVREKARAARLKIVHKMLNQVKPHEKNPRRHPDPGTEEYARLKESLANDYFDPLVFNRRNNKLVSGHLRRKILIDLGFSSADMVEVSYDEKTHLARMLAANELTGQNDDVKVAAILKLVASGEILAGLTAMTDERIAALIALAAAESKNGELHLKLTERFGVPPFSVLDARQGYWQDRKATWLSLGIQSEVGRGGNLLKFSNTVLQPDAEKRSHAKTFGTEGNVAGDWTGTSIFDPVLCELAYRWFCPPGGIVLDPFAGGSVRGIVAAWLGRDYVGIDLRKEQIEANEAQWKMIAPKHPARSDKAEWGSRPEPTPWESREGYFFKRDDFFEFGGANGGKVRIMLALIQNAKGIVTCGDRTSTQISRAALVAKSLGIKARIHTASGDFTSGMIEARAAGSEIIQHKPGYLSVLKARALKDAEQTGFAHIPWALEHPDAVFVTQDQVQKLPPGLERIVVPCGSGMTLAGVLRGLNQFHKPLRPVLGVLLGGAIEKRLDQYAPKNWRKMVKLVRSKLPFHQEAETRALAGVDLDPIYEAKCIPFLKPGDGLWIVGRRSKPGQTARGNPRWLRGDGRNVQSLVKSNCDFFFTCPPYFDLEQYSNSPHDLSNAKSYTDFIADLNRIIQQSCELLRNNRFAAIVVGDIRDPEGAYRNFVSDTIRAFSLAGLKLYNEAILVTAVGSLPIRIGKQFNGSRKLGKTHQNVLIFCKGDPRKATAEIGEVEFGEINPTEAGGS